MKNIKTTACLTALCMALTLLLSGCAGSAAPQPAASAEPAASADPMADCQLTGPWGLSMEKNDMAALYTVFGTSLRDYGSGMEIKSDGQISYYVGAAGGAGTYTRDGGVLTAQLTDYNEGAEQTLALTATEDGGRIYLVTAVYDTTLWWTQDAQDMAAAAPQEPDTSAYDEVLAGYRAALEGQYDDLQLSQAGLNYMLMFCYSGDPLANVGFCFKDLDGDGSPELLIGAVNGEDYLTQMIFDAYTLSGGSPVLLFSGGERDRYYILSDGTLYNEGSGSAFDSVYRSLAVSGGALSETAALRFDGSSGGSGWTVSELGGEPRAVSAEEAQGLIAQWQSEISAPDYSPMGQ